MPHFTRQNVKMRTREEIAEVALSLRAKFAPTHPYLDVVGLAVELAVDERFAFNIEVRPRAQMVGAFAYTTTSPARRLIVSHNVWNGAANDNDVIGREVIAHELAHLMLHDHAIGGALAFLADPRDYDYSAPSLGVNRDAEEQAREFTKALLAPDLLAASCDTIIQLRRRFGLPWALANERFKETRYLRKRAVAPHVRERIDRIRSQIPRRRSW